MQPTDQKTPFRTASRALVGVALVAICSGFVLLMSHFLEQNGDHGLPTLGSALNLAGVTLLAFAIMLRRRVLTDGVLLGMLAGAAVQGIALGLAATEYLGR